MRPQFDDAGLVDFISMADGDGASSNRPWSHRDTSHLDTTRQWILDYVLRDHPRLNRTGPVCPFVGPALRQQTLLYTECHIGPSPTVHQLHESLLGYVAEFRSIPWRNTNAVLHALVVTFPRLTDDDGDLLDRAHALAKHHAVLQHVMVGQFHPRCGEPAARNPGFLALQSPVPMVAIRNLAFHDILFLHSNEQWFSVYDDLYGKRYGRTDRIDPLFVELYLAAKLRFRQTGEQDIP